MSKRLVLLAALLGCMAPLLPASPALAAGPMKITKIHYFQTGTNLDTSPDYPASFNRPNQLTVESSNSRDQLSSFSSYSANVVHLAAPGENILSETTNKVCSNAL